MTAPTTLSPAERVAAGAAHLDAEQPDWLDLIRAPLDMGDANNCVLGQVYGDYWDAPLVRDEEVAEADNWAVAHGFQALQVDPGDPDAHLLFDYDQLAEAWDVEIQRRRGTATP